MNKQKPSPPGLESQSTDSKDVDQRPRHEYVEPKLTYVAPKLIKHGTVTELTGYFGTYSSTIKRNQ